MTASTATCYVPFFLIYRALLCCCWVTPIIRLLIVHRLFGCGL